jgi:hypothetical protein
MHGLAKQFAATTAAAALADMEGAFDRAVKQARPGRQLRALVALREKSLRALDRGMRMPADIIAEALEGIHATLHSDALHAFAKRASGPGQRDATMTSDELVQACIAIGAEFTALFTKWLPIFRRLGAEPDLARWRRQHAELLDQLFRVRDIASARAAMIRATETLLALYDDVRIRNALPSVTSPPAGNRR